MLKIFGMLAILLGAFRGVQSWYRGRKERIRHLEELIYFLQKSGYVIGQQIPLIDHLRNYKSRDKLLEQTLLRMAEELEGNLWESGEAAWQAVLSKDGRLWDLRPEQWECLWGIGRVLCGGSKEEICERILLQKKRLERELQEERRLLLEQQKIVMPVGMMAGGMLILLLL